MSLGVDFVLLVLRRPGPSYCHCLPVRLSLGTRSCQFGRACAPMMPQLCRTIRRAESWTTAPFDLCNGLLNECEHAVIPLEQVKDTLSKLKGATAPKFLFTSFPSPHLVRPTFRCTRVAQFGAHYAVGSSARSDASGSQGTFEQGDRTTT